MDLSNLVVPGAQSLVSAILSDSWAQARSTIVRLWARRGVDGRPTAPDAAELEHCTRELDEARRQAMELAASGPAGERAERLRAFWTGYLLGQLSARPELADAIAALPGLLGGDGRAAQATTTVRQCVSGTVHGAVVQTGDVSGGIRLG